MLVFTPGSYIASVSGLLDEFAGMTIKISDINTNRMLPPKLKTHRIRTQVTP